MKQGNIEEFMGQKYLSEEEKQKLLDQLKGLEETEVPESLQPEAVVGKLQKQRKMRRVKQFAGLAAMLVLGLGIGAFGLGQQQDSDITEAGDDTGKETLLAEESGNGKERKEQVGNFKLAGSYEELYAAIQSTDSRKDFLEGEMSYTLTSGTDDAAMEVMEESQDYSTTNLQVEGVDEGDIVKNDGEYLYICAEQQVYIVDIRQEDMEKVATIRPEMKGGDRITEIFVEKDRLIIILNIAREETSYEDSDSVTYGTYDVCYMYDPYSETKVLTYDITNRGKPELLGTISQDGGYKTARKVGDYLYLFTEDTPRAEDPIPLFNREKATCDSIYYQKEADHRLMVASMNVENPGTFVDYLVLMDHYGNVYVSNSAIYVYGYEYWEDEKDSGEDWRNTEGYTGITKFSFKDGMLSAESSAKVRGDITDTFAISEREGILRVLTTEWKEKSENRLYVFDEQLERIGYLSELAVGEEIYSARYIGDMAYFITYHNTDPLFVVDLSDVTDPKLLGHVEITGFSDYLHPYGEGLLLGIGYETGENGGDWQGVKLVMFDVTDPAQPKVLDSVLVGADYSPAIYNYKCVLADSEKNLIGFSGYDSRKDGPMFYLYSWEGDHFSLKMKEKTVENGQEPDRSMYANDRLYLCLRSNLTTMVRSFDLKNGCEIIDRLTINQ